MLRKWKVLSLFAVALAAALVVAGCGGGDGAEKTLVLSFKGVETLSNGYHYEGWALINGKPVTTGKFNVDASGAVVDLSGKGIENGEFKTGLKLREATAIVLTIEPAGDKDTVPTATHVLAGDVSGRSANLTVGHRLALGDSFGNASGKYILATPTDGDGTNETSGIWFLDLTSGGPTQGLRLPTLPPGWAFEGWVVISGKPVTTGRFVNPGAADLSAPYSGPQSAPPFPGEDFLRNAPAGLTFPVDISGGLAVISLEPDPDDSPGPFTLKPLVEGIPASARDHFAYDLSNKAGAFPTGTATIK